MDRISANPVLFGWNGAALEGFIFGETTKNMALGIALQKIRLDEIVMKLFNKRLSCKWLNELNVGMKHQSFRPFGQSIILRP